MSADPPAATRTEPAKHARKKPLDPVNGVVHPRPYAAKRRVGRKAGRDDAEERRYLDVRGASRIGKGGADSAST
jgi:hypothetical protein